MEPSGNNQVNNQNMQGQYSGSNQYPYPGNSGNSYASPAYGNPEQASYGASPAEVSKSNKDFGWGFLVGVLVTAICVGGFFGGRSIYRSLFSRNYASIGAVDTATSGATIKKIQKIENLIHQYYYKDEDIDIQKIRDGMYSGMMDSMGDPYSVYYDEDELKELLESSEGVYHGIGAYMLMNQDTGIVEVSGTIAGTPAEAAGLRAGDKVIKVNDENVQGMDLSEVVSRVRGEIGTQVHLTLYREGETDYLELDLVRAKIESPTVTYKMLEDQIGYIQITEFDDITLPQFKDAYAEINAANAKGLILDLRGNPGGNVDTVVDIANQILPKGNVVYTLDKYGKKVEYPCDGLHEIQIPLVVLVDGYSASASEILAGAIRDYEKGKLVGTTTFGKGIVQQVISLNDGTAIKITESSYYSPLGKNIHGIGIEPDVEVPFDGDAYYNDGVDNQLEKGIEVLTEMMK